MEFDELLNKVTAMLRERGRVSYAALKQYFGMDDALVKAVREELVFARRVAVDENDRVLVARGDGPSADEPQAERRHLTVMFVDMVGSSDMAARLDPEDFREIVRTYQLTVASAIERYHGYVAQYLGDGLLIYFGYPHAHEDDPRRAVFAAMDIMRAIESQNTRILRRHAVRVVLRIGVHTGLVVMGEVGSGERLEALALGKTPNVAARLEALAEPETIVVSGHTKDLLKDMFVVTSLGMRELKGIPGETEVYRVDSSSGVRSAFDLAVKHKLLPLAGRRSELAELVAMWERARRGRGAAVLVTGEAGIGKSRLAQALKEYVTEADNRWIVLRTSPYHTNTPLYPIVSFWHTSVGISETNSNAENLALLEASLAAFNLNHDKSVAAFAKLLQIRLPDERAQLDVSVRDVFISLGNILEQLTLENPRLLLLEDMQWADPSTLELARRLMTICSNAGLLVMMTARPEFDPSAFGELPFAHMTIGRMPRADVEQMITSVAGGRTLSRPVRAEILRRTGGVPAFVEEFTRMLVESDWLKDDHGHLVPVGPMPATIPDTLKDSLMARLDKLGEAKVVAQQAAVLGRAFPSQLLHDVVDLPAERIDAALDSLETADVLKRSNVRGAATYVFRHVLLQQAAYDSVLKAVRQATHLRAANALEADFQALVEQQPERVAQHLTSAGELERAIGYWQWAGELAVERAAYVEAHAHLREGMSLLRELPQSSLRDQRELSLLNAMGPALVLTGGWAAPALGEIYGRVMELLAATGGTETVDFQVLGGLCAYHLQRGELKTVHTLADRLVRQSVNQKDDQSRVAADTCLAAANFFQGNFAQAQQHCESVLLRAVPFTDRPVSFLYGQDPSVIAESLLGFAAWVNGDFARAHREHRKAIERASGLSNPFSLCLARVWYGRMLFESAEFESALEHAQFVAQLSRQKEYAFAEAMADMIAGASLVSLGRADAGLDRLRHGIATWKAGGNGLSLSYYCHLLGAAEHAIGDVERAQEAVSEGLALAENHGELFWRAELYRLQAEILADSDAKKGREFLLRALTCADEIDAHMPKARAAYAYAHATEEFAEQHKEAIRDLDAALKALVSPGQDAFYLAARDYLAHKGQALG